MVLAYGELAARGWWGTKVQQVLWVHDEYQYETDPDIAEEVGQLVVAAMEQAGRVLKIRCPIIGEYKVGRNWAETH